MAYTEVMGSRREILGAKEDTFIELGIALVADTTGTPVRGDKPTKDTLGAATAIGDYRCVEVRDDAEVLPGLRFLTSVFKKIVVYA